MFLVESVNSVHGLNGVWWSSKNSPNNFILPRWFCSFYSLLQSKDYLCITAFYSDTYYFQKLIHSASATPQTLACIRQLRCPTSSIMAPRSRRSVNILLILGCIYYVHVYCLRHIEYKLLSVVDQTKMKMYITKRPVQPLKTQNLKHVD